MSYWKDRKLEGQELKISRVGQISGYRKPDWKHRIASMKHVINRIYRLSTKEKLGMAEVIILLGFFRLAMILLPFKQLAKFMGSQAEAQSQELPLDTRTCIDVIRRTISVVQKYTPWQSKCLVQAMCAQFLLKKRGIISTLYLGLAKEGDTGRLLAHAWLECGGVIVTGERESRMFSKVTQFTSNVKG